jgi:hypothetical protein
MAWFEILAKVSRRIVGLFNRMETEKGDGQRVWLGPSNTHITYETEKSLPSRVVFLVASHFTLVADVLVDFNPCRRRTNPALDVRPSSD